MQIKHTKQKPIIPRLTVIDSDQHDETSLHDFTHITNNQWVHILHYRLQTSHKHYSKDVVQNIYRTQATEIDPDLQNCTSTGPNKSSVWIYRKSVKRFPRYPPKTPRLSVVTLTFDIQTHPIEGPNTSSLWIWCKSIQQFPEIFHTQSKKVTDSAKKPQSYAADCVR